MISCKSEVMTPKFVVNRLLPHIRNRSRRTERMPQDQRQLWHLFPFLAQLQERRLSSPRVQHLSDPIQHFAIVFAELRAILDCIVVSVDGHAPILLLLVMVGSDGLRLHILMVVVRGMWMVLPLGLLVDTVVREGVHGELHATAAPKAASRILSIA